MTLARLCKMLGIVALVIGIISFILPGEFLWSDDIISFVSTCGTLPAGYRTEVKSIACVPCPEIPSDSLCGSWPLLHPDRNDQRKEVTGFYLPSEMTGKSGKNVIEGQAPPAFLLNKRDRQFLLVIPAHAVMVKGADFNGVHAFCPGQHMDDHAFLLSARNDECFGNFYILTSGDVRKTS